MALQAIARALQSLHLTHLQACFCQPPSTSRASSPGPLKVSLSIGCTSPRAHPPGPQDVRAPNTAGSRGQCGPVRRSVDTRTQKRHAGKAVDAATLIKTSKGARALSRWHNDIAVSTYLAGHPNIVAMYGIHSTADSLFVVQELCSGGMQRAWLPMFNWAPRCLSRHNFIRWQCRFRARPESLRTGDLTRAYPSSPTLVGTLHDMIRVEAPLDERRASGTFRGIVRAVLHCHQVRTL